MLDSNDGNSIDGKFIQQGEFSWSWMVDKSSFDAQKLKSNLDIFQKYSEENTFLDFTQRIILITTHSSPNFTNKALQ